MPIETKRMNQVEFLTAGGISVPHGFTTRYGGVSTGTQASLNLAYGRGDTMENVVENLRRLGSALGFDPEKLVMTRQTHSDIVRVVTDRDCRGFCHKDYPECDALVTNTPEVTLLVFTADLLAENIHFLRRATSARELGRKSLAVNLSDVAAMGARPIATLLSLAIPHDLPEGWIEDFMEGYRDLSAQYDVGLVGGDTTASDSGLVVNVTAIGRIADSHIKRRSDARPGDLIAVGGSLGESGAGLRDILAGRYDTPLAQIHRNPAPQVAEGIWLGERPEVHAMMDISDGIASDLRHILHQSGVGAEVDTECIPTPVDLETAVSGGEDYKLLFTVAPESANTLLSNYRLRFGDEFHFIGRITGGNHLEWLRNGTPLPVDWQGFRHY